MQYTSPSHTIKTRAVSHICGYWIACHLGALWTEHSCRGPPEKGHQSRQTWLPSVKGSCRGWNCSTQSSGWWGCRIRESRRGWQQPLTCSEAEQLQPAHAWHIIHASCCQTSALPPRFVVLGAWTQNSKLRHSSQASCSLSRRTAGVRLFLDLLQACLQGTPFAMTFLDFYLCTFTFAQFMCG